MKHPGINHDGADPKERHPRLDPVAQAVIDCALGLVVGDLRDMLREQLGDQVEQITTGHFEYIGTIPTGIPVEENEIIYTFRKVGGEGLSLLVATFEKNENGMPNTLSFKGTRLFPDMTKEIN